MATDYRLKRTPALLGFPPRLNPQGVADWWGYTTVGSLAGGIAKEIPATGVVSGAVILCTFQPTSVVALTPAFGVCSINPGSSFAVMATPSMGYVAEGTLRWLVLPPWSRA